MKIAIFPGSFDPITVGHENILKRGLSLFDKIYIALGTNIYKKEFFPLEVRLFWLKEIAKDYKNVEVISYKGLTIDCCKKYNASFILRGLRTSSDFDLERSFTLMSRKMDNKIEMVYLFTEQDYLIVSSTNIKDIIINNGDFHQFIPKKIYKSLNDEKNKILEKINQD